jgi:hypothetical protein
MDITNNNGHEEFGPTELVEALRIENRQLTEALESAGDRHSERLEALKLDHQNQLDRLSKLTRLRDSQRAIAEGALLHLRQQAYRQMETIGDVDQATESDGYYLRTVERAFRIGRVLGYSSECRNLAYELELADLWDKVSSDPQFDITDESERYSKIQWILAQARTYPDSDRHPMSAEYKSLWRNAFRAAKQAGLCDEYQRIAGYVGIPTDFEMPWTGTVRVYVEGYFDIDVSGDAQDGEPDAYDAVSDIDLRDHIGELEITAEFQEVNYDD